jgi:uncharacterized membrane protein (UPF0127 family)
MRRLAPACALLLGCAARAPAAASACSEEGRAPQGPLPAPQTGLAVLELDVGGHAVRAEVADTPARRERGLMARKALAPDSGMLFVYPEARERGFWMQHTLIPLTIAYLDDAGTIVHLADMEPLCTDHVPSERPARYALEMERGWFALHGVREGARVGRAGGGALPDGRAGSPEGAAP